MASHHRYPRRARRSWCAGLAVVVIAGLLAYAGTAPAAARAAAPPGSADPPAGGLLSVRLNLGGPSGPAAAATLGVPTAGVDQLQVTLNGHPVALPPVTGSGAQRVLNLAELGGLRFGTNQLQVRLVMTGGAVQAASRTFILSGQRDIAAARALTPATTGRTVTLDASRSLLVPGTGGLATARWTLVRRPAGSHARLGSAAGAQVTLRPDLPGYYLVGLRVGSGPATGVDLLTVRATYSELLVPFNTIAQTAGLFPKPGIQIENSFYQDPEPGGQLAGLQMLVLDRATLAPVINHGYQGTETGISFARDDLEHYNSPDYLVIITHPGPEYAIPAIPTDPDTTAALETLVGMVGGTVPGQWAFPDSRCWSGATDQCYGDTAKWERNTWYTGSFSFIGVPGMPAGQAWRETAAQLGTPDGNGPITGFFTQGALGESGTDNYTVVNGPDPYVPVQTCTTDGCDVTVGDHAYAPEAGVSSGMHVVVLNRTTLNLITNTTVTTADGLDTALQSSTRPVVGDYAGPPSVDDQRLVILQSIGTGKLSAPVPASLLQYISQFGGTPDYLWDAISPGPGPACRYALIGAAADLPWQGTAAESSTAMKHGYTTAAGPDCNPAVGLPTGQLAGTLQRDRDGLYAPGATNAAGVTDNSLYQIMFSPGPYQPDQAWPMDDDVTGLTYVADHIGLCPGGDSPCYPDVRSAYTNDGIIFTDKLTALSNLPDSCDPSVCGPDFPALKAELLNEFMWVDNIRDSLMYNLRLPYQAAGPATVFSVKDVTQNVINALNETENQKKATMQWLGTFSKVMTVGQAVAKIADNDLAAQVFGKLSDAGVLATEWLTPPSGVSADSVTAAAYQLAETINGQQLAYIEWTYLAQDILVSTYQQLHAAGTKIWSSNGISFTNQVSALSGSAAASAYSALFPVAWDGYNLKPGPWLPGSDDVSTYECSEIGPSLTFYSDYPFTGALPDHQFHAITSVDGSGQAVRQVWTFAHIPAPFQSGFPPTPYGFADLHYPYAETPPPGPDQVPLTDAIYGPDATGANIADKATAAYQYEASWWWSTYNPPSHTICNTSAAYGHTGNQPLSTAWPPPDIQKPPV